MALFTKMRIAARLLLGFGAVMLLIAVISGFSIYSGKATTADFTDAMRLKGNEVLDQRLLKRIEEARATGWKFFATGEETAFQNAQKAFDLIYERAQALREHTTSPEHLEMLEKLVGNVRSYQEQTSRLKEFKGHNPALDGPDAGAIRKTMASLIVQVEAQGDDLAGSYEKAASEEEQSVRARLERVIVVASMLGSFSLGLGLLLSVLISRSIVRPVSAMTDAMGKLAASDLTVMVPATERGDEVGRMAQAVQIFKDNALRMRQLTEQQEEAKARTATERRKAMNDMADNFETQVMTVVTQVSSSAEQMRCASHSMAEAADEANSQATSVAAAAEQASMNVQTVATAAEELSASIAEISRRVTEAARISEQASEEAARADRMVQSLADAADKIGNVAVMIDAIAGKTNLLALNATIEAARSGEAGKGFAVVAGEVKALAHQTAGATGEIGRLIAEIQQETQRSVAAIHNIGAVVSEVRDISAAIASAVEEQGAATQEIARNVEQAAQGTEDVSSSIIGVTRSAATTGAAASQVASSAGNLAENSTLLRSAVCDFLATVRAA